MNLTRDTQDILRRVTLIDTESSIVINRGGQMSPVWTCEQFSAAKSLELPERRC